MLLRDDAKGGHVVRHQRIGSFGFDVNGVIAHLGDRLALEVGAEARRGARDVRCPLKGEDHVIGGKRATIVKLHTLAQLELPRQVIDRLPRNRQPRQQLLLGIGHDQAVENFPGQCVVGSKVVVVRVDGGGFGLDARPQFLRRSISSNQQGAECQHNAKQSFHDSP